METKEVGREEKFWILVFVVGPFIGLIIGIIQAWGRGIDLISGSLAVIMYFFSTFGITIGFHRLFTHKSFVSKSWLANILAVAGSTAAEGSLFTWVGWHLTHHVETDTPLDPHSPHKFGTGFWNMWKGYWHSHVGWLFITPPADESLTKRLREVPSLEKIDRNFKWLLVAGMVGPSIVGIILRNSFEGVVSDFLWAGVIRLFFVHHVTWCVNSVCHIWGDRPFVSGDKSTNNWIVALFAHGEGWHHNHHVFPRSARHGLLPGQLDLSWCLIFLFERFGWVSDVVVPNQEKIEEKLKTD